MEKQEIKEGLTKLLEAEKLLDVSKDARTLIRSFNETRKKESAPTEEEEEVEDGDDGSGDFEDIDENEDSDFDVDEMFDFSKYDR